MKHFRLALALAAVLLIAEIFTTTALVARKGDIDNDGAITVSDARLALRFAVKLDKPTEIQKYCADIDGTKRISVADARTILRAAVKLQTIEEETKEFTTIPPSTTKEETTKKNTTEEVTAERSSSEKVTTEKSTTEESTTEKVSSEESATEEVTTEELTTEEASTEEYTTEEASAEESTTDEVTTEELTTEEVSVQEFTTEETSAEVSTTEKVTEVETTAEVETTEKITEVETATEVKTTEEASTEEYTTKEATSNESTTEEATTEEYTTKEATTNESTTEEAITEEYTTEEVTTEESPTETTTEIETTTEESTTEVVTETETTTEAESTTEEETTEPVLHTHKFTEIVADHALDGKHKIYCECGEYITENCECTDDTVAATCTQGECVIYTCTKCGDIRSETTSKPLGHDTEVLPGCIFAKEALIANRGMYVSVWPICKRCGKAPTNDISLFNDTVNLIKNDRNYRANHRFTKITKTSNTTVTDTEKTEITYNALLNITDFKDSNKLPYFPEKISSLTNDDTESFDVEYLKDGIDTTDLLKDYPDIITVNSKEKNIKAYKNKIYAEPTIRMTVKIKSESFTVGSTDSDNLYTKYTSDNSYECAMSRITNDLTPLSDAEAFGSDNNFVNVSEQNGITTSITLNDITVGGTVTYCFDYATLTPLFAVYDLQQTTEQIIKVTDGTNVIQDTPTTRIKQCKQIYIFE